MFDELKEESIVNKVGGRFKLSTLIQKRLMMLNTGSPQKVDSKSNDKMAIILQEIIQDKIFLDVSGEVATRNENTEQTIRGSLFASSGSRPVSDD